MSLFDEPERRTAQALAAMSYGNPFLPERLEHERTVLDDAYIPRGSAWHKHVDDPSASPNLSMLQGKAKKIADQARKRLLNGDIVDDKELTLYELVVFYFLYSKYREEFNALVETSQSNMPVAFYTDFLKDLDAYLRLPKHEVRALAEPAHIFAGFFQVRRAFHYIYEYIIGGSRITAGLRAAVWQSIFSNNMQRYRRELFKRMGDIATLVMGPSGTGKELVAQAIGLSRYVPFDPKTKRFAQDGAGAFHAVNVSALSPTLIESELFGHRRGAFTGAVGDHAGWLEACQPLGAVFLDEIGELEPAIQVKLLRTLETRTFQRVGEHETRQFQGKIIAATNRDLHDEVNEGRMRADFYYRLCSDVILVPPLRDRLRDDPNEMHDLLLFLARAMVGEEEAETIAKEVRDWAEKNLGDDYPWPGNVRELGQCMRNILIHGAYQAPKALNTSPRKALAESICAGKFNADELLRHYTSMIYADTNAYQETARRLDIDGRTVKSKIDPALVEKYKV